MGDSSNEDRNGFPDTSTEQTGPEPTIVGGRPLTRGQLLKGIPRGIEVLIKKASVDPEFRATLLEKRADAAAEIELDLSATETAMLNTLPAVQIEKIIGSTTVPTEHRRVFLGKAAAAMLSVLAGVGLQGCLPSAGITYSKGITPDRPERLPRKISGTKVPPGTERLKVDPKDKGPNGVDVLVGFDNPFDSTLINISFRNYDGHRARQVACGPAILLSGKGKSEVTFSGQGTSGKTRWIQAEVVNNSKESQSQSDSGQADTNEYQAGEFLIKDLLITHIIEFRKEWKP